MLIDDQLTRETKAKIKNIFDDAAASLHKKDESQLRNAVHRLIELGRQRLGQGFYAHAHQLAIQLQKGLKGGGKKNEER